MIFAAAASSTSADDESRSHGKGASHKTWRADFDAAQADAQRLNKPLLIHFYAEWCVPCRRMEREFLDSPELLGLIGEKFIAVKVDTEKHTELIEQFDVRILPSDMIIAPDGHIMAASSGYQDRQNYIARLARAAAGWKKLEKMQVARHRGRAPRPLNVGPAATNGHRADGAGEVANAPDGQRPENSGSTGDDRQAAALDGYCPVTLWHERVWRKGRPEFTAEHKGLVFHMVSPEALEQFRSNRERYAPRLLGCDPVILWETDRALAGRTEFAAFFRGELYLFVNDKTRAEFKNHPLRYARVRHVLNRDDFQGSLTR